MRSKDMVRVIYKRINRAKRIGKLAVVQNGKCVYCLIQLNELNCSIDHIMPICKGGSNKKWNMQLLCIECNQLKGDTLPWEYEKAIGYERIDGYEKFERLINL